MTTPALAVGGGMIDDPRASLRCVFRDSNAPTLSMVLDMLLLGPMVCMRVT
jgi:hypothetical protein